MVNDIHNNFRQNDKIAVILLQSITFDHFKADNGINFLISACHFIQASWILESCYLSVVSLELISASHTGSSTVEIIRDALQKFYFNYR